MGYDGECRGKRGYESVAEAQGVIDRMEKNGAPHVERLAAYRCGYCGKAHVGNRPRRRRSRRRRRGKAA